MDRQAADNSIMTALSLCRQACFGQAPEKTEADWEKVLTESLRQSVLLSACACLPRDRVPEEVLAEWDSYALAAAAESLRVSHGHGALTRLLAGAGIPCLILKGLSSSAWYPDPSLRMLGDVDFMVPEGSREEAVRVLTEAGYEPVPKEAGHHLTFKKGKVVFELHHELPGLPGGESGRVLRELFSGLFERAEEISTGAGPLLVPCPFHQGLILILHNAGHWTSSGIGLRHLFDLALFMASFSEEDFRALFEEPCRRAGLWEFVRLSAALSARHLGGPERAFAADVPVSLTDAMLEDVLASGNFGQKVRQRHNQRVLLSEEGKGPIRDQGLFGRFLASLGRAVRRRWPLAERIPLLYPIGALVFGTWYLIRILMGKRQPIHLREIAEESERRHRLYKAFALYEPERESG